MAQQVSGRRVGEGMRIGMERGTRLVQRWQQHRVERRAEVRGIGGGRDLVEGELQRGGRRILQAERRLAHLAHPAADGRDELGQQPRVVAVQHLELVLRLVGHPGDEHAVEGARHRVQALEPRHRGVDAQAGRGGLVQGAEAREGRQAGHGRGRRGEGHAELRGGGSVIPIAPGRAGSPSRPSADASASRPSHHAATSNGHRRVWRDHARKATPPAASSARPKAMTKGSVVAKRNSQPNRARISGSG